MNITFVSIENSIKAIGFRKMASMARQLHPETEVCYIVPTNAFSILKLLTKFNKSADDSEFSDADFENIAHSLAKADIVCFSSMSNHADLTKKIITSIRSVNLDTFIIWGGIHPIIHPEDAIEHADAICVGEGEKAYSQFLAAYKNGDDFTTTKNFWFNTKGGIIRNAFLPLHTPEELESFPYQLYKDNELIYKKGKGFAPMEDSDYLAFNGLGYMTIWSIGCPFRCNYCSNTKFIENDKEYKQVRYPSVDYIIGEVQHVLKKHPHISEIQINDDGMMAIDTGVLKEFAEKWRERINLPYFVGGVTPPYVTDEKMEVLTWGGMTQLRMGIQSGSDSMLSFYNRPNKPGLITNSTNTIGKYSKRMMPPYYDIIVDNPIETKEDVVDTLNMLYNLPRPFFINIFSLRIIPNTTLAKEFEKRGVYHYDLNKPYKITEPTLANVLIFSLQLFKPPKRVFNFLLKYAEPFHKEQPKYRILLSLFRTLWLMKIGVYYLVYMNFSLIPGRFGWFLWKTKIMKFYHKYFINKYLIKVD